MNRDGLAVAALALLIIGALLYAFWAPITRLAAILDAALTRYEPVIALLILLLLALLAAAIGQAALGLAAALRDRARRDAIIDRADLPPIDIDVIESAAYRAALVRRIEAQSLAEVERAVRTPAYPALASLTYAPHLRTLADAPAPASAPAPAISVQAPPLRQLLDAGDVGRGRPLLLGIDAASGEPVRGSFRDLYSAGIGGVQGSGKTWTATLLLAQTAAHGGRLVICDPHAGDRESLASRCAALRPALLCDVADDPAATLNALRTVATILDARKRGDPDRRAVVAAVDEWLALARGDGAEEMQRLIEAIVTEGRKLNVHCLLLAQRWHAGAIGDHRNALTSAYVHRMRPAEARMLTGYPADALPGDTLSLPPGHAYLVTTSGDIRRVLIPAMTEGDIERLASAIPSSAATEPPATATAEGNGKPAGSQPEAKSDVASSASGSAPAPSPEAARIAALFLAGKSIPDIVKEVYGLTSSGGRAYQERRAEVEEAIRSALRGGTK